MKVDSNSNEWFAAQGEDYVIELQNGKYNGPLTELANGVIFGPLKKAASRNPEIFCDPLFADALQHDGFCLFVPPRVAPGQGIVVRDSYSGSGVSKASHTIIMGQEASVRVFYEFAAEGKCDVERTARFLLADDARLDYGEFIDNGTESQLLSGSVISYKRGSQAKLTVIKAGGGDARLGYTCEMSGSGSGADYALLYLCGGSEKVDIDVRVNHNVPECRSNVLVKGIAGGYGEGRFNGLVYVAPDAQQTEAYQQSRNILLSEAARIVATPQLEIYADDVRCSHGATVGRQDGDQIYYMRQRGIPQEQARRLMLAGFMNEVLDRLPEGTHREAVSGKVDEKLAGME